MARDLIEILEDAQRKAGHRGPLGMPPRMHARPRIRRPLFRRQFRPIVASLIEIALGMILGSVMLLTLFWLASLIR